MLNVCDRSGSASGRVIVLRFRIGETDHESPRRQHPPSLSIVARLQRSVLSGSAKILISV